MGLPAHVHAGYLGGYFVDLGAEDRSHGPLSERGTSVPPSALARRATPSRACLGEPVLSRRRGGFHDGPAHTTGGKHTRMRVYADASAALRSCISAATT